MTPKEILALARGFVGDENTSPAGRLRQDEQFLAPLNAGLNLLWHRVPAARLDSTGLAFRTYAEFDGADWDETLWPDGQYRQMLAHYLAFYFFTNDAGDTRDSLRAKAHKEACTPLAD